MRIFPPLFPPLFSPLSRVLSLILALAVAGVAVSALAAANPAGGDDDDGYSTDATGGPSGRSERRKTPEPGPSIKNQQPQAITIEGFDPNRPEGTEGAEGTAPASTPAAPPAVASPAPGAPPAFSGAPRPSPAAPPAADGRTSPLAADGRTSPPAAEGRSPVASMLNTTLQGKFSETVAIKENLPKKTFSQAFDRATANKFSRLGNELVNKQNNPAESLKAYEAAYSFDRSSPEINGSYGYLLFLNGRFEEAREKLFESLEISPGYAAAWFTLGQVFGYLKQEDRAYASFVNTMLFTKNITTTLGFVEREKEKQGEVCVQNAAARALELYRKQTSAPAP